VNEEQNNFSQNNLQNNNGITNNQTLNNQEFNQNINPVQPTINTQTQQTTSFQQAPSQMNMGQPQQINTIENGNSNNQIFTTPPKKINIGLIIGIVVAVAVIGVGIVFGSKLFTNDNSNNINNNLNNKENSENNTSTNNSESLNAKVKIGDKVAYTPSTTENESYECSAFDVKNGYAEIKKSYKPGKQNWIYIGEDENGNSILTTDKAISFDYDIGGKNGYLYGEQKLNELCSSLYSNTTYGTARSINIQDIIRVLNYTGPMGQYSDKNLQWQDTPKDSNGNLINIGELSKELGTITNTQTPESNKKLEDYVSNGFQIHKENEYINKNNIDIIFTGYDEYWIASQNVFISYYTNTASFGLKAITGVFGVKGIQLFTSNGVEEYASYDIRPVIVLNDDITFGEKNSNNEWTLINK